MHKETMLLESVAWLSGELNSKILADIPSRIFKVGGY